jgi:septum formation topological specificity factor MinE
VAIQDDQIKINIEKDGSYEVLELNIALSEADKKSKMK